MGGFPVSPYWLAPQQVTVWLVCSPQAWFWPAVIWVNCPGGVLRRLTAIDSTFVRVWPEQAMVPSVRIPHDWRLLAKMWVNRPDGVKLSSRQVMPAIGVVAHIRSHVGWSRLYIVCLAVTYVLFHSWLPQQTAVLSARTAQVLLPSAASVLNGPSVGSGVPALAVSPQQAMDPFVFRPHARRLIYSDFGVFAFWRVG